MSIRLCFVVALLAAAVEAGGQEACGPNFHQFDFWIGEWNVTGPDGTSTLGQSSITSVASGCTIREQWTSTGGIGYSLNMYDATRDDWTQVWMDDSNATLHLTGGLVGNAMVLSSTAGSQVQRVTWSPLTGGRVRQHWQLSNDGGSTWSTIFDGYYSPK